MFSAREFIEIIRRMCNAYHCEDCPLYDDYCSSFHVFKDMTENDIHRFLRLVENWGDRHDYVTNKEHFLEGYSPEEKPWQVFVNQGECISHSEEDKCSEELPCPFCLWWHKEFRENDK